MKKILVSLAIITILIAGCTSKEQGTVLADFPYYQTIDEYEKDATNIISGKVISSENKPDGLNGDTTNPYTVYTIEVDKEYKGKLDSNQVEVAVMGGYKDSTKYNAEGLIEIAVGKRYVFALCYIDKNAYPQPINYNQGIIEIDENNKQITSNNDAFNIEDYLNGK